MSVIMCACRQLPPSCKWPTWTVLLILNIVFGGIQAQDDFGDDSDSGGEIVDMESMMGGDRKKPGEQEGQPAAAAGRITYIEQTAKALQQLALVIGVAFMVAFLFLFMVALERLWERTESYYQTRFGKQEDQEAVHAAALVGTFKRYKN